MARLEPTTALDLFRNLYHAEDADLDLSLIRIHPLNDTGSARAQGALAYAEGMDVYFRAGCYAPHTAAGLWLLAHEVAHVVQQRRGPVAGVPSAGGALVGAVDGAEEREASAAAFAVLAGQPFFFGPPSRDAVRMGCTGERVTQRFMGWEHLLLGNLEPADFGPAGDVTFAQVAEQCALAAELSGRQEQADADRLPARAVRLPGSGVAVTLGELNILPDYFSHPADINAAPAPFMLPLVQAMRAQNHRELTRLAGRRGPPRRKTGTLSYPVARAFPGVREAIQIDALGRRCGLPPWERYLSVLGRNACHFAPFSWYRWRSFHLLARRMIAESAAASGAERQRLRGTAQVYAGYADHFLQDSFAVGHLANKTLIMQWYIEWLLNQGGFLGGLIAERSMLAEITYQRQPFLHGPGLYGTGPGHTTADPQSANEAPTLDERIALSGVCGDSPQQRLRSYLCYLTLLRSSVAQLPASVVHDYFNRRSLVVASRLDGPRFQVRGDRTMLAGGARPLQAAAAAHTSRRAIDDLLDRGDTGIASGQIFESMPRYIEVDGALMPLRQWHDERLRPLCFEKLFKLPGIRGRKLLLGLLSPFFGMPSADYAELRTRDIAAR